MNILSRISPPVWIFGLTLLAIVLTGRLVGTSPCERAIQDCYLDTGTAHANNAPMRQASPAECAQTPCEVKKRGALIPIAILITGFVILLVWFRHNAPAGGTGGTTGAQSSSAPGRRENKPDASTAVEKAISAQTPVAGPAPVPDLADVDEASMQTAPPFAGASALSKEERTFCFAALRGSDDQSKENLTLSLCRLIAPTSADQWKGARLADLELLVKTIAAGALFGPTTAKYRAGLRSHADVPMAEADPEMLEQTKKALADQCLLVLRHDLKSIVDSSDPSAASSQEIVADTAVALDDEGALSSLSKCGKEGLLRLSVFLTQHA